MGSVRYMSLECTGKVACPAPPSREPPFLLTSAPRVMQSRLVTAALEAALGDLKAQCPAVVSSRRERSLGRALPLLSKALAGGGVGRRAAGCSGNRVLLEGSRCME